MKKLDEFLPILQSSLPPLDRSLSYMQEIEINRCHTNFGKLFKLFEKRMADFFEISIDNIAIVCNGTLALVSGLMALDVPANKYCLMPSWTFSATPASAQLSGLVPCFLDVEPDTQTLTVNKVFQFLEQGFIAREEIGAVMVTSPFGFPVPRKEWDEFTKNTGIPVIIDAAASFDAVHRHIDMKTGDTPMMVSLHATKIFGIGEGGILLSTNTDLIKRVKGISNFGFDISRHSSYLGMNAKISEYQAAIGLAVLDSWNEIRERRLEVTSHYISLFNTLQLDHWLSPHWLSSNCNLFIPHHAEQARDYLVSNNIESRIWWNKGCHTHPAYQKLPKELKLPHTHYLSQSLLGVPFSIDTSKEQIHLIGGFLAEFIENNLYHEKKLTHRHL